MQRGALFRHKWTHIDSERGFITINGEEPERAKSNREERIPLIQPVPELLAQWAATIALLSTPDRTARAA